MMLFGKFFQPPPAKAGERSPLLPNDGNRGFRNDFVDEDDDSVVPDALDPLHDGRSTRRRRPLSGERFDDVPDAKRQLAGSVLIARTRIYATPSNILRSSGSVGMSLVMWLIGATIACCGSAVYTELGTGLPRSGGEKNYIEFIYRRPKFLATCIFAVYSIISNTCTANSVVFTEYLLNALSIPATYYNTRLIAWLCLTSLVILHGTRLAPWGLRLQNTLGVGKLLVLSAIAISGLLCLARVPGFQVREGYEVPDNFSSWEKDLMPLFPVSNGVIWSFIGYSNANYALSEIRDPVRTIKRAAPLAMCAVTAVYLLINIAYFAAVSKNDISGSKRIVAALFFRNLFGPATEKVLSAFIALSTFGNVLAGQFSQGRVVQELGREGVVPFSSRIASNKPWGAPLTGLLVQYLVSCTFLFFVPSGDAYFFMISFSSSYCLNIVNALVALGLFLLYTPLLKAWDWDPPFRANKAIVAVYLASNVFLLVVPLVPPLPGLSPYQNLPYWSHAAGGFAVSLVGITYWYVWSKWLPQRNGYRLEREVVKMDDGITKVKFKKVWPSDVE
ncbi:high-affinity methionine permease [Coprinopsis sp. MPI-PUGE-AT-0042]|nr:high-affinity methionine permease [Coprinopsis sp. MPI-PUGE-AT-0042]